MKILKEATLAGGCFWCIEGAYNLIKGIISAKSGYSNGEVKMPTYEQVCSGKTGHAEVVRLVYDEDIIGFEEILQIFFTLHDPTQLNRQGNDIGTQYRSAIFYHDQEQRDQALAIIEQMTKDKMWPEKIVTEVSEVANYFEAEKYHQGYAEENPQNQYCQMVVSPKLAKFRKTFAARLKDVAANEA